MGAVKLKEDIYSVGVLNPSLRVFDIIMKTEFGTSYNAYLVKGKSKIALIETVHVNFFDEYIQNIEQIVPISEIDYIILNHTEPDHSGSLAALLAKNPNIVVISSVAGLKYLEAIANCEYKSIVAKNESILDLGGKTIKFISAPLLHWPDSMFSYVEEEKLLFSCDFLGAHYCEPRVLDEYITYLDKYEKSFEYYFKGIFGPFKEYVIKGLDKIASLDIDMICPSHGPVLVNEIVQCIDKYRKWCDIELKANHSNKVSIFYVSAYGCTRKLAECAADVARENGYEVETFDLIKNDMETMITKLHNSGAIMFGSPTINRDALKPIWDLISCIDAITQKGKKCALFGSYGWSGEAVGMLKNRLCDLKFDVYGDGFRVNFVPSDIELSGMREYAKGFFDSLK